MTQRLESGRLGGNATALEAQISALSPITTAAQLEDRFPAVGGVHTVDRNTQFELVSPATSIDIGANRIVAVFPASLYAEGGRVPIVSSAEAPVISGETCIRNLEIVPTGVTAAAKCIDLSAATNQTLCIERCRLTGTRPGNLANIAGIVLQTVEFSSLADGGQPLILDGFLGVVLIDGCIVQKVGPTPKVGIRVLSTAVFGGSGKVDRCSFFTNDAGDALLDISTSIALDPNEVLSSSLCQIFGPGELFAAGSIDERDPRMVSQLQVNGKASIWLADAFFLDSATPIILTQTGGAVWDVVPFENVGAASVLQESVLTERFDLNRDAIQDWQVRGTGRTDSKSGFVSWNASVLRAGGGANRPFRGRVETRPDSVSPWVPIVESESEDEMAGSTASTIAGSAPVQFNRTTQFRLTANGLAATDTAIESYRLQVRAS